MDLKPLGKTGIDIPVIGLGTWAYRGGAELLRRGISLGAWLIDTAESYGTEAAVGDATRDIRDRVFIATKVSPHHLQYRDLLQAADDSLRRLRIDHIDLYQVHWPNPRVPIAETMGAMEELVDSGKVRFIGVSNFDTAQLQEAQRSMRKYEIVSNQVLYNLEDRNIESDLLPYCRQHQVTVIAYSPLGEGSLGSRSRLRRRNSMEVLQQVAAETSKTLAQVALNWCVSRPNVVAIPRSNSLAHTEENCAVSGWSLAPEQIRALDEAFA